VGRKLMAVTIRGDQHEWSFCFYGNPKHLDDWLADGLEVALVENTVPAWLPKWVPVRWWCFVQDVFNFRNPWRG